MGEIKSLRRKSEPCGPADTLARLHNELQFKSALLEHLMKVFCLQQVDNFEVAHSPLKAPPAGESPPGSSPVLPTISTTPNISVDPLETITTISLRQPLARTPSCTPLAYHSGSDSKKEDFQFDSPFPFSSAKDYDVYQRHFASLLNLLVH